MPEIILDVRSLSPRERHPRIFETWEKLPVGDTLRLVNDHDPKPLFYEFRAERTGEYDWNMVEEGPERWIVAIKKVVSGRASPEDSAVPAPEWAGRKPDCEVDVREDLKAGREPLSKIMDAARKVQAGGTLLVRAIFAPRPLYAVLASQGFEHWARQAGPENWEVYFLKKG